MTKITDSKKLNNKIGLAVLIVVCVLSAGVLSFKYYVKYKEANTFDFDLISPEGYFTDLATSSPE